MIAVGAVTTKGEDVKRMTRLLRHRGPDNTGYFNSQDRGVYLGFNRLSIVDLSDKANQPIFNEDKSLVLVLNGEIYNYQELRSELEKKGHIFKSNTDTETVVHLYEEYQNDCVRYLRGMFAFAVWDEKKQHLLLARDRLGKKPLLYAYKAGRLIFASEFRSILASGFLSKDIQYQALHDYLSLGYIPAPMTVYKDVFKLLPAHILLLKDNNVSITNYWQLDYSKKIDISEDDAQKELLRLLEEAVKIRLYSDVPLGAFLSGGIDSSAIVAIMARLSSKRINTFAIGFDDPAYNELSYARKVARRYNTNHNEFTVKPNVLELLPRLVEHYGEPYADSSSIPTYYVSRMGRKYVTVALNGDGGDEIFAGYDRYYAMLLSEKYQKIPLLLRRFINSVVNILPAKEEPKKS